MTNGAIFSCLQKVVKTNPGNYRHISLTSYVIRVFERKGKDSSRKGKDSLLSGNQSTSF